VSTRERYTHGQHPSVLNAYRWRSAANSAAYLLDELRSGQRVLDVGCGPGTITLDLASLVAPGEVVGVDQSATALDQAREAAAASGAGNVRFEVQDAYALSFDDASFDVVHAHQVVQHLSDPVAAIAEMRRVCAPGGVVALRDADYGAFTWYPEIEGLTRWRDLYERLARANGGEPDAGRRLIDWARRAGFEEVRATASVWLFAAPEEREYWGGQWAERVRSSSFAEQALESGLADRDELERLAGAFVEWAASSSAFFAVLHGEVLCRR
jgi:ubiquinone/menaquinone biosynthesis C-methylase UbiE